MTLVMVGALFLWSIFPQLFVGRSLHASVTPVISSLWIFWLIVDGLYRLLVVCRCGECTMVEARRVNRAVVAVTKAVISTRNYEFLGFFEPSIIH